MNGVHCQTSAAITAGIGKLRDVVDDRALVGAEEPKTQLRTPLNRP